MTRRDVLELAEQAEVNVNDLALMFQRQRVSAQAMLQRLARQGLLRRRWDGVRFWYLITDPGQKRLDWWRSMDAVALEDAQTWEPSES